MHIYIYTHIFIYIYIYIYWARLWPSGSAVPRCEGRERAPASGGAACRRKCTGLSGYLDGKVFAASRTKDIKSSQWSLSAACKLIPQLSPSRINPAYHHQPIPTPNKNNPPKVKKKSP